MPKKKETVTKNVRPDNCTCKNLAPVEAHFKDCPAIVAVAVMGRPKELTPELIEEAKEYLASCKDERTPLGVKVNLPKIEGLARFLGVHRDTLYTWEKDNDDISDILDEIRLEQASRLMDNGLAGTYNSTIAKLLLGKHGYRDSSEVDHTSKGERIGLSEEDKKRLDAILSPSHDNQTTDTSGG